MEKKILRRLMEQLYIFSQVFHPAANKKMADSAANLFAVLSVTLHTRKAVKDIPACGGA